MQSTKVESVFELIGSQTAYQIDKLYQSSWACKAIFQSLSSLSKIYVMRLLFIESPVATYEMLDWVKTSNYDIHQKSIEELLLLRIFVEYIKTESNTSSSSSSSEMLIDDVVFIGDNVKNKSSSLLIMNKKFQENFKITICNPVEPWSNVTLKPDKYEVTHEMLDSFSLNKWNDVLKALVNLTPSSSNIKNSSKVFDGSTQDTAIYNFLERANLIKAGKDGINSKKIVVTPEGKSFLLKDYQSQVWAFVSQVIRSWTNQEDALTLLFMLSYCEFGKCYAFEALSKSQKQLVYELYTFGIIYTRDITVSTRFYPTRIAINMIFQRDKNASSLGNASKLLSSIRKSDLKIIVQTNNQVIAYVSNDLHIAMLKMFIDIQIRMPNMILGRLTRARVKEAYDMDIDSKQIMDFLIVHAHPIVANKDPVIPSNISDQLLIWEMEKERVRLDDAIVIDFGAMGYITSEIFNKVYSYGRRLDAILWIDPTKLMMAVKPTSYDDIESYAFEELRV